MKRIGAIAVKHVERHLGIKHVLGQLLERQQIDGLLVQFVHAALAAFGGGLQNGDHGILQFCHFLCPQQQQRQHH